MNSTLANAFPLPSPSPLSPLPSPSPLSPLPPQPDADVVGCNANPNPASTEVSVVDTYNPNFRTNMRDTGGDTVNNPAVHMHACFGGMTISTLMYTLIETRGFVMVAVVYCVIMKMFFHKRTLWHT